MEVSTIAKEELQINEEIRDKEVRLIDENGNQQGVVHSDVALRMAEEAGLDLVKIAPQATPPVCKIMDYGKYKFEQGKREKEAKKNQKVIDIKEIRLSATIDTHDMEVKAKATEKFLKNGDKVKVTIRFRGRQIKHGDLGLDVMDTFYDMVKDSAAIDRPAKQEGRNMFMILTPKTNYYRRNTPCRKSRPIGVPQNASALPSPARSREQRPIRATFLPKRPLSAAADCVRAALLPSAKPKRFAS